MRLQTPASLTSGSFVPDLRNSPYSPLVERKMGIQLKAHGPKGEVKIIDLCDNELELRKITVRQLKKKITTELGIGRDGNIRIVYRTETLEDSSLLISYRIQHMSTIHVVLMLPGGN